MKKIIKKDGYAISLVFENKTFKMFCATTTNEFKFIDINNINDIVPEFAHLIKWNGFNPEQIKSHMVVYYARLNDFDTACKLAVWGATPLDTNKEDLKDIFFLRKRENLLKENFKKDMIKVSINK